MFAPATRDQAPLPHHHPCAGCPARTKAVCGVLECDELSEFRSRGGSVRVAAGQPLFHEGAPANRVFSLTKGTLKLYKLLPDGRRQVTGFKHPGDLLGVSVDGEHAFTAEALETAELCSFALPRFDSFVETHAEIERELYRRAVHELADAQQQMVLLGRKTAAERLASFFVDLAERAERGCDENARFIDLPMSRSDIADYLGLTKETVSRILAVFKHQRVVRLEALDRIEILDRDALETIARGDADS